MEVYKYNKCLLDRFEESMCVLHRPGEIVCASKVHDQWSSYLELQVEPTGWQAIWNIPRVTCETLQIRYPTSVFGYVEHVDFKDLRVFFLVKEVQDDDVMIGERQNIPLEEVWPTVRQDYAVSVEITAECLDRFRFFYQHVWMPWDYDNDDDISWVEKHLESRIRFCYDLRNGSIKSRMVEHIRALLTEAKYIHQRRLFLDSNISEIYGEDCSKVDKSQLPELMRLHLRLSSIRDEIEMIENPEMRHVYEQDNFSKAEDENMCYSSDSEDDCNNKHKRVKLEYDGRYFIIAQVSYMAEHIKLMRKVETKIAPDRVVELSLSLMDTLIRCKPHDKIFIGPGLHKLKFLENLKKGQMIGITPTPGDCVEISSADDDSILLVLNGNYTLENLRLNCRNVRIGILIKNGNITLRECTLTGDNNSSTQQGIVCSGKVKLTLIDCVITKFANGIEMQKDTELILKGTVIVNCNIGLELSPQVTRFYVEHSSFVNAKKCGILIDNLSSEYIKTKRMHLTSLQELPNIPNIQGDCKFTKCHTNIKLSNGSMALIAAESLECIRGDSDGDNF